LLFAWANFASGQNSTWIFGWGASVNFEEGEPTTAPEGPIFTGEGAATISDSDGQLLFSTDGVRVYDRNGDVMEGGTGLQGDESSTQSALIAPRPLDSEERFYHVFTVSAQDNQDGSGGMYHSIVDMDANGGLGEMITTPELLVSNVGEKLHATMHADGTQMWIVTHQGDTNDFYAFLLTCEGIDSENPVISSTGDVVDFYDTYLGAIGSLKISPNGEKIAMTNLIEIAPGIPGVAKLQTGTFDNETGVVEIIEILEEEGELIQGYGVEFSPNSNYVYWSSFGMTIRRIIRFNLSSNDVQASRYEVSNSTNGQAYAALQLGPDDRIYIARSNGAAFLSRIDNPDAENNDDLIFTENAVDLNGISTLGLPNDWNYQLTVLDPIEDFEISVCTGESVTLAAPEIPNAFYSWSTGELARQITVNEPGFYSVKILHPCLVRTENYTVSQIELPEFVVEGEKEFCEGEVSEITIVTDAEIDWWDGVSNPVREFNTAGNFSFTLSSEGCTTEQVLTLSAIPWPDIAFEHNVLKTCQGMQTSLIPEIKNSDSLFWSTGETKRQINVVDPGIYTLNGYNACGVSSRSIELIVEECDCSVYIPNSFTPNEDGLNDRFRPICDCEMLDYNLSIFNRWGQLVFQSTDPGASWSGNHNSNDYYSPLEVYAYQLKCLTSKNGKTNTVDKKGSITVLR